MPDDVSFSFEGEGSFSESGKFKLYEGTSADCLAHMTQKGLAKENIINFDHNGTNYFVIYWK